MRMIDKIHRFVTLGSVLLALPVANAAVIQTNASTSDGTSPGGALVTAGNLLASNLLSATALSGATFIYPNPPLSRLYDGTLGSPGASSGNENDTVMPDNATLQFDLNRAFNITTIRTYAGWDSGRDGQRYEVKYATASAPTTFTTLYSVTQFDPPNAAASFSLVTLTDSSGVLASNVVSLQFVFTGYENGGTGFREFQVLSSPVPETGSFLPAAVLAAGLFLRRRRTAGRGQAVNR